MGFTEVSSLDADNCIAIGKTNKQTGKPYPKQAEGYYLGFRVVENKRGDSKLFFLQTPKGNLGVWGTTDLSRKLVQVPVGSMVRITSTGTKPTPNGDMYTYKVEIDKTNTIEVAAQDGADSYDEDLSNDRYQSDDESEDTIDTDDAPEVDNAAELAARKAKVDALLNKGKRPNK